MFAKRSRIAAVVTAALSLGLTTTASAESIGTKDPQDVRHGVDLRAVHVENTDTFVRISLTHTDLVRDVKSNAGGAVYIDTDREDAGPELVFVGGYFEGTDYQLLETEGFGHDQWGEVVDAFWRLRLNYKDDRSIMRMSRDAVGADDFRVAVRVAGSRANGTVVSDWLGRPRSFTPWVERG